LGSIGKRHARLIRQHLPHDVWALRSYLGQEQNDLGIPEVASWAEADEQAFDVAIISNPTFMHIETATRCAEHGLHLFIEKPVDCSLEGLDDLLNIVRERSLSTYVAYPLRFHPVVRAFRQRLGERTVLHAGMICASFLPDWRPNQDYRRIYSRFREQGGGVFLEMSHELDMAEFLFGPVRHIQGTLHRVSDLTADSDDCADVLLEHSWGTTNVQLDMFSRYARRLVEVETPEGHLRADLREPSITEAAEGRVWTDRFLVDPDLMYVDQLRYFFDNLGRPDMQNSLPQASHLYRKMIEFRKEQGYGTAGHHLRPGGFPGS
jgi:predicted dehydrogenase